MTTDFIKSEAYHLLTHEELGGGMSRKTYSSKLLPDCVVKCESGAEMFQNIIEWETWHRVKDTEFAKWFAPCRWISPSGSVLIMERTTPATRFPEKMPVFLTDFKRTNYGMLKGRLVCHDYGTNLLFDWGLSRRMKKANWWDAK